MNEIVKTEPKPVLQAGGIISGIVPQNLDEAFRLSSAIHQAGMSPYGLDTPQKVMIAMLAGLELGMPPMQGVQSIAVINNRPCMWGDGLIGVVRTSKACLYVKEWTEGEGESRVAYCETKRRGEDEPVVRSFSVDDAKRAGLWQTSARVTKKRKDGGTYETANDSPWFKYPQRMLQMRARAWCLRDVYPDVLKGMQAREEVEDHPEAEGEVQPAKPTVLARLQAHREPPQIEARPREGFSPSFAADEAATLSSEPSASPADESGDAAALPSTVAASDPQEGGSSEEGDNPGSVATEQPAPSSESSVLPIKRVLMEECVDNMLRDAFSEPADQQAAKVEKLRGIFLERQNLGDHAKFVNLCAETVLRIVGKPSEKARARDYLMTKMPPAARDEALREVR